jgi:putative glutamine amidotransferase
MESDFVTASTFRVDGGISGAYGRRFRQNVPVLSNSRPVIGVTSYIESASWRVWRSVPAALISAAYVHRIADAGGAAVVLPPLPSPATEDDAKSLLSRLDGLVLSGGSDIDPARYGASRLATTQEARPDRDDSELLLARVALGSLPVLGICRGMQVMAVAAGGALDQHLPQLLESNAHSPAQASYGRTSVRIDANSRLASILGTEAEVDCYHHQGVATHPGYVATAWGSDGLVEAMELPGDEFNLGVQWHPEVGTDARLFQALLRTARA